LLAKDQGSGHGRTSLIGGLILAAATIPFVLISATTPFAEIGIAMLVRGIGIGLSIMPAMTAAFSVLSPEQVNDASPQLTVLQRVGGSLGTAIIAVVLQGHIQDAHTQAALASGFAHTYWWVMAVTLIALLPTLLLARIERRARNAAEPEALPADTPLLEAA
jgi:MFS family permease